MAKTLSDDDVHEDERIKRGRPDSVKLWARAMSLDARTHKDGNLTHEELLDLLGIRERERAPQILAETVEDGLLAALGDDRYHVYRSEEFNWSKADYEEFKRQARLRTWLKRHPEVRAFVVNRDRSRCRNRKCRKKVSDRRNARHKLEIDHLNPRLDPRTANAAENLIVLCRSCNRKKGRFSPDEVGIDLLTVEEIQAYDVSQKTKVGTSLSPRLDSARLAGSPGAGVSALSLSGNRHGAGAGEVRDSDARPAWMTEAETRADAITRRRPVGRGADEGQASAATTPGGPEWSDGWTASGATEAP